MEDRKVIQLATSFSVNLQGEGLELQGVQYLRDLRVTVVNEYYSSRTVTFLLPPNPRKNLSSNTKKSS